MPLAPVNINPARTDPLIGILGQSTNVLQSVISQAVNQANRRADRQLQQEGDFFTERARTEAANARRGTELRTQINQDRQFNFQVAQESTDNFQTNRAFDRGVVTSDRAFQLDETRAEISALNSESNRESQLVNRQISTARNEREQAETDITAGRRAAAQQALERRTGFVIPTDAELTANPQLSESILTRQQVELSEQIALAKTAGDTQLEASLEAQLKQVEDSRDLLRDRTRPTRTSEPKTDLGSLEALLKRDAFENLLITPEEVLALDDSEFTKRIQSANLTPDAIVALQGARRALQGNSRTTTPTRSLPRSPFTP